MRKTLISFLVVLVSMPALAQQKSAKRGIGWDEKTQSITNTPIEKMLPGVSWLYNWGAKPTGNATNLGTPDGMDFAPMCWNGGYDANAIRNYVKEHKGVKYLLGFNEPNFSAQSNMTPAQAAEKWHDVGALAEELNLKLVAPALNNTNEFVGGKKWGIYEWLDEFIKVYKEKNGKLPHMDCLALHCYMNWYSANTWFATEYFYKDLYEVNPGNNVVGKYPNIVELLDSYKAANGHFPRMMLTEFCSWEGDKDGFKTTLENQIDQMTQKVQKLEQSDLVEGYAWFMANAGGGIKDFPYMSVFEKNTSSSELSTLGKVYVHMSSFDTDKYYAAGEMIQAKDYVDATTDDKQVKVRPNTEKGSSLPLQVELPAGGSYPTYQIEVPADGEYKITAHVKSSADTKFRFYVDNKRIVNITMPSTAGAWQDFETTATLTAGKHSVMVANYGSAPFFFNSWKFDADASGIENIEAAENDDALVTVYSLGGVMMGKGKSLQEMNLAKGVYIVEESTGKRMKSFIK